MKMQNRIVLLLVAALSAAAAFAFDTTGFAKKLPITMSGYTGTSTLTNFPVLVKLSTAITDFDYADFQGTNGSDLRFVDADGNLLAYETEKWDTNGISLVWVKVPELTASTEITTYYGNADAGDSLDPTNVWTGYTGVWHFGTVSSGASPDSTGHGLSMTANLPAISTGRVDGVVGACVLNTPDSTKANFHTASYAAYGLGGNFTVSGWFKHIGSVSSYERVFSSKTSYDEATGFEIEHPNNDNTTLECRGADSGNLNMKIPAENLQTWRQYSFVYNAQKMTAYTNGVASLVEGTLGAAATDSSHGLAVGGNANNSETCYKGLIDEVRIRGGSVSADWAKAEYDTIASSSFAVAGAVTVVDATLPVVAAYAAQEVTAVSAVATGAVRNVGSSAPEVSLVWGTDAGAFTTTNSLGAKSEKGGIACPLTGLLADTTYYYAFLAVNDTTNILSNVVSFRTAGAPVFGVVACSNVANAAYVRTAFSDVGVGNITLTCWIGTSADTLVQTNTWTGVNDLSTNEYAVTGLDYGQTYYYAFRAECAAAGRDAIVVWSATNSTMILGTLTWTGGGADTAWLTPANWDLGTIPTAALSAQFTNKANAYVTASAGDVLVVSNLTVNAYSATTVFDMAGATLNIKNWTVGTAQWNTTHIVSNAVMNVGARIALGAGGQQYDQIVLCEGAKVTANDVFMNWSSHESLTVDTGASLSLSSLQINDSSSYDTFRVATGGVAVVDSVLLYPPYNSVVIDGGVMTNNGKFTVCYRNGSYNGTSVDIMNGGFLKQAGTLKVDSWYAGKVRVLTDGRLEAAAITMGDDADQGGNGRLIVSNGTVTATSISVCSDPRHGGEGVALYEDDGYETSVTLTGGLDVGNYSGRDSGGYNRNSFLSVNGGTLSIGGALRVGSIVWSNTNQSFSVAGASSCVTASSLTITNRCFLNFTVPASGFKQVPVRISGTALIDATTKLVVDADAFAGTGDQILLSAGTLAADSIPATNIVLTGKGKIVQTDGEIIFRAGAGGFVIRICDNDVAVPSGWATAPRPARALALPNSCLFDRARTDIVLK